MRAGGEIWSDFPQLVKNGTIQIVDMSITADYASQYGVIEKAEAMNIAEKGMATQPGASRIVIDSLSSLEKRLSNPEEFREVFMKLLLETKRQGSTCTTHRRRYPSNARHHRIPCRPLEYTLTTENKTQSGPAFSFFENPKRTPKTPNTQTLHRKRWTISRRNTIRTKSCVVPKQNLNKRINNHYTHEVYFVFQQNFIV